jgi:N-acetyltransferase
MAGTQALQGASRLVPAGGELTGEHVALTLLRREHCSELLPIALDPALWQWTLSHVADEKSLARYIDEAVRDGERGAAVPFLIRARDSGLAAGCTRFGNIELQHDRAEIGWTWVGAPWQRTAVNTEAKYLLLRHAFETAGLRRVEFKTDALNARSRAALLRIGAHEEGIFRQHMKTATGRIRDTVYFSILSAEWPRVKTLLEERLRAGSGS